MKFESLKMTDGIVSEWLTDWNNVSQDPHSEKVSDFAESVLVNEDLFQAITHVLEENERFRPVCILTSISLNNLTDYLSLEKSVIKYFLNV